MRHAVIDLGTNTFHLFIAECDGNGHWRQLVRQKVYVKLAEDGIHRISDAAFDRAMEALQAFKIQLEDAGIPVAAAKAFGTAALRTAENAAEFLKLAYEKTGIRAESISGDREAELIYKGVRRAVPLPEHRALIMDIGGGSVEFIIADREKVYWQQSFPIGVAVLFRTFHKSDPISFEEVDKLELFLEAALEDLWRALARFDAKCLIGASGTFDVIDLFLLDPATKPELYGFIELTHFEPFYEKLIKSTLTERRAMPLLPPERVDMIVVALVLIRHVLRRQGIRDIYTSTYAMKEGMLEELCAGN